jgi:hypothetical protein
MNAARLVDAATSASGYHSGGGPCVARSQELKTRAATFWWTSNRVSLRSSWLSACCHACSHATLVNTCASASGKRGTHEPRRA